jgi:hypothetical protein
MMIVSLVLSGCAVTEKLSINPAGDGRSDLALSAEPFFIDVLNDFEEFSDTKNPESVMDKAVSTSRRTCSGEQAHPRYRSPKQESAATKGSFPSPASPACFPTLGRIPTRAC